MHSRLYTRKRERERRREREGGGGGGERRVSEQVSIAGCNAVSSRFEERIAEEPPA